MEVPRLDAGSAPLEKIVESLQATGAVIVEGLLTPEVVDRFNRDLAPYMAAQETERNFMSPGVARFYGKHTKHLTGLASKSATFVESVMCSPVLLDVCDAVLRPNCVNYQLNLAHIFERGPGAKQQYIHRDEVVWVHLPQPHREVEVSTVIALVDFTEHNGATRVVPGSHLWPRDRLPLETEIATAVMPAGSAIIYLGSTLHAGGANTTANEWRRGMHMSYVVGWLRPEENHILATPPDKARHFSRRAKELLGYGVHNAEAMGGGYIGSLDLQDPIELMEQGVI